MPQPDEDLRRAAEPELRLADRPSTQADTFIAAGAEAVFAAVSDLDMPARFGSEFRGARRLGEWTTPAEGAQFLGRNAHPAVGEWETLCTVVTYDPPRELAYTVQGMDGTASSTWRFTVTPDGDGCRLTQSVQFGPGRSYLSVAIESMPDKESRILRRRLAEHRANMEANLAGVKEILEG